VLRSTKDSYLLACKGRTLLSVWQRRLGQALRSGVVGLTPTPSLDTQSFLFGFLHCFHSLGLFE